MSDVKRYVQNRAKRDPENDRSPSFQGVLMLGTAEFVTEYRTVIADLNLSFEIRSKNCIPKFIE